MGTHPTTGRCRAAAAHTAFVRESRASLFVVDDDDAFVGLARGALSTLGHVVTFHDARAALDAAAARAPDLVVSEIVLRELGGFGLLSRLVRQHPERPPRFLFVSSLADDDTHTQCLEAGADDYLAKPVSAAVLRARAKVLLRRSGRLEAPHAPEVLRSSVPINSHSLTLETRVKGGPPHVVTVVRAGERELLRKAVPFAEGLDAKEIEALRRRIHDEVESTMRDRVSLLRHQRLRDEPSDERAEPRSEAQARSRTHPEPARARVQRLLDEGLEHALAGRWAEALALWEAGLALEPDNVALRVNAEVARRKAQNI